MTLPSDDGPALEIAECLFGLTDAHKSTVHVKGNAPYDVLVIRGITAEAVLEALRPQATEVLLAHVSPVEEVVQEIAEDLHAQRLEAHLASHPEGETARSLNVVAGLWDLAGRITLEHTGVLVMTGGGTATNMADFVATAWSWGIDLVAMPTTLLAMVGAATGGEMRISTAVGKSPAGSFHPPRRVLCNLNFLPSLPERDSRADMAEVLKCGFISDEKILTIVEETEPDTLIGPASSELRKLLERAIGAKARVISEDPKESGLREILNYGHTFAHAIKRCEGYTWHHGEMVTVDCIFAVYLTRLWGLLSQKGMTCHIRTLSKMGPPTSYENVTLGRLKDVIASDKKARQGRMRFIPPKGIARPETFQVEPFELDEPAEQIGVHP